MQKAKEISEEKVIIVISSLMVWNNTAKKMKQKGTADPVEKNQEEGEEGEEKEEDEEKKEEDEEKKEEGEEGEEGSDAEKKKKAVDIVLTDDEEIPEAAKDMV